VRPPRGIRVGNAGKKGRGVFATKDFLPDDLLERAPIIILDDEEEVEAIEDTRIADYWYEYANNARALGLGFTSLYNHSRRPNATYSVRDDEPIIEIVAVRPIKSGAEITVNYNGDPRNKDRRAFERWSTKSRRLTKTGAIAALQWMREELRELDLPGDAHLMADLVRILRRIPASEFKKHQNGKK